MKGAHPLPHCRCAPWRNYQPKLLLPLPEPPVSVGRESPVKILEASEAHAFPSSRRSKIGALFSKTPKESRYEDP